MLGTRLVQECVHHNEMRFGACLCFARVWLSNDRATQKSMVDYAKEYLAYGVEVSALVFELLVTF